MNKTYAARMLDSVQRYITGNQTQTRSCMLQLQSDIRALEAGARQAANTPIDHDHAGEMVRLTRKLIGLQATVLERLGRLEGSVETSKALAPFLALALDGAAEENLAVTTEAAASWWAIISGNTGQVIGKCTGAGRRDVEEEEPGAIFARITLSQYESPTWGMGGESPEALGLSEEPAEESVNA